VRRGEYSLSLSRRGLTARRTENLSFEARAMTPADTRFIAETTKPMTFRERQVATYPNTFLFGVLVGAVSGAAAVLISLAAIFKFNT